MAPPSDNNRVALDRFTSLCRQLVQHMDLMVKMGYIPLSKYPVRFFFKLFSSFVFCNIPTILQLSDLFPDNHEGPEFPLAEGLVPAATVPKV